MQLLADGLPNKQVASQLGISPRTVERHCDKIYSKLGVASRTEAVVRAISSKLVRVADDSYRPAGFRQCRPSLDGRQLDALRLPVHQVRFWLV